MPIPWNVTSLAILACLLSVVPATPSAAQADPFGMPQGQPDFAEPDFAEPGQPRSAGATRATDEPPEAEASPLVKRWEQRARGGPVPLAESAAALARLGAWKQVDNLLTQADAATLDDATLTKMGREIGPALMIRINQREDLSRQARDLMARISEASANVTRAPEKLRRAISQLGSTSVDARLAAVRTLMQAGTAAVQELVGAAVTDPPPAPIDEILRLLNRFGSTSDAALGRLAIYGNPDVRIRAVDALVRMGHQAVVLDLLTMLHADDSTDRERSAAASHLLEIGVTNDGESLPGHQQTVRLLSDNLRSDHQASLDYVNDDQSETMWTIDPSRSGVQPLRAKTVFHRYRDVVDAAARLRRLAPLPSQIEPLILAADLRYRVLVDPDWGDPDQSRKLFTMYGQAASAVVIARAIDLSSGADDVVAMVGLIRIARASADRPDGGVLVSETGSEFSPLVRAADHPDARVRYEAAAAIATLRPSLTGFPGSSRVRSALDEMRSLDELPVVLLLETRPDVVVAQERLLASVGYKVLVAPTVRDLERRATAGGDIRMIVSKTQLADLSPIELVDRVRRHRRSREIPIVFYGRVPEGITSPRWNGLTTVIERPVTGAAFAPVLQRVERRRLLPPLSRVDRRRYRETADAAFANLAAL
jgi:hypothetical protein